MDILLLLPERKTGLNSGDMLKFVRVCQYLLTFSAMFLLKNTVLAAVNAIFKASIITFAMQRFTSFGGFIRVHTELKIHPSRGPYYYGSKEAL